MILLTLSRGKGEETVRLQLPASPAEIGETFAFLDRISLDSEGEPRGRKQCRIKSGGRKASPARLTPPRNAGR